MRVARQKKKKGGHELNGYCKQWRGLLRCDDLLPHCSIDFFFERTTSFSLLFFFVQHSRVLFTCLWLVRIPLSLSPAACAHSNVIYALYATNCSQHNLISGGRTGYNPVPLYHCHRCHRHHCHQLITICSSVRPSFHYPFTPRKTHDFEVS